MFVSTQDGVYVATRHQHNSLKITTETLTALDILCNFVKAVRNEGEDETLSVYVTDHEFAEFITAQVQDLQYTNFPPVPEPLFI